jgi:SAM-dependent methyltransferase
VVRVRLRADRFYAAFEDPWGIGAAGSARYDLYHKEVCAFARRREAILDIGCGYGAFLARFRGEFDRLVGVDASETAVRGARERYPFLEMTRADAGRLYRGGVVGLYDAIVFSDVINYLREREKHGALRWIGEHLAEDGIAFVAAWSPGGRYLTESEFRRIVSHHFAIEAEHVLDSGHVAYVATRKRVLVSLSVDHETWQPVPAGRTIEWDQDVFNPTAELLSVGERCGAKITLMAEIGEHAWLRQERPDIALRLEAQWRDALARGHDVQLHVHPAWLPEAGAMHDHDGWHWDDAWARIADHPDPTGVISHGAEALRTALRSVSDAYEVVAYRAGAYEAQPFSALHAALLVNRIKCDSSVLPGDRREGRTYDYRRAASAHQPYYANRFDPQLPAPAAEQDIIELPVFAWRPGQRWTFDASEGEHFAERLQSWLDGRFGLSTEALRRRRKIVRGPVGQAVSRLLGWSLTESPGDGASGHLFFVLVGHTKLDLRMRSIERGLRTVLSEPRVEAVTLTEMVDVARSDLERTQRLASARRSRLAGIERVWHPPALAQHLPLDRQRLLVAHLDAPDLVESWPPATERREVDRRGWDGESDIKLENGDWTPDAIVVPSGLERSRDPSSALEALRAGLALGGALLLAVPIAQLRRVPPVDGRWVSEPAELRLRLEHCGFCRVRVWEEAGSAVALAWREAPDRDELDRIDELLGWAYVTLSPGAPAKVRDPLAILAGGHGWCADYTTVLGEALRREGHLVRWVTMVTEGHPRGRGSKSSESHAVLEVGDLAGTSQVLDPTTGVRFPHSIETLIRSPEKADVKRQRDSRYVQRSYDMYSTSFWYKRITTLEARDNPTGLPLLVSAQKIRGGDSALWKGGRRDWRWLRAASHATLRALTDRE